MVTLSLLEIAKILDCSMPAQNCTIQGISRDTRQIARNNLYVAIKGEQFDGHDFVIDAAKNGAVAALVSHPVDAPIPQLVVADTLDALGKLSAYWRNQFDIPLIGVTGSNGKTTLKNMIASILTAACHHQPDQVLATEGNLNNNIGLPLMLLRLNNQHRYSVIEMGMNHFNEIAYLTKLTKPMVAIINNAGETHLEGVKSIAGVAQAKGEIFQGLPPEGTAILNRDDTYFNYWLQLIGKQPHISFGMTHAADIYAETTSNQQIIIHTPQGNISLTLPLPGAHNVMNALAATAATLAINIDLADIKQGLEQVKPTPGRMYPLVLENGATIIDDTYNASPTSLNAAAKTLATYTGTKIMVLGDMKELGDHAKQTHFDAGVKLKALGFHHVFTLGDLSAETARALGKHSTHFTDHEALANALKPYLKNNTTILVKGSRSMKMEKIIELLIPEKKFEHTH